MVRDFSCVDSDPRSASGFVSPTKVDQGSRILFEVSRSESSPAAKEASKDGVQSPSTGLTSVSWTVDGFLRCGDGRARAGKGGFSLDPGAGACPKGGPGPRPARSRGWLRVCGPPWVGHLRFRRGPRPDDNPPPPTPAVAAVAGRVWRTQRGREARAHEWPFNSVSRR